MTRGTLKTALATRGHTQPLKDGTVKVRGFELDFQNVPNIITAFRRMVRGQEFDISEMAMTTYLCAREHGTPFTATDVAMVYPQYFDVDMWHSLFFRARVLP